MTKDTRPANSAEYREWAELRRSEMAPMFAAGSNPTVKSLLFLALLEDEGRECDYERLLATIRKRTRFKVSRESLRVAVRDLSRMLDNSVTPFHLTRRANGVFQLDRRHSSGERYGPDSRTAAPFMDFSLDHALGQQQQLVDNLMRTRVVPPYSVFYLPTSAALWSTFFSDEQKEKKGLIEAGAWNAFGIRERLDSKDCAVISVVGLSVGEGYGELKLLKELLSGNQRTVVHYVAIDISPGLLLSHLQHLHLAFSNRILDGRLVCAGVLADIFDLSPSRDRLSTRWDAIWRAREIVSPDFLPRASPWIVTYFGNAMGNEEQNSEPRFFELLRSRLGDNYRGGTGNREREAGSLHCIVGVAGLSTKQDSRQDPESDREAHERNVKEKYNWKYRDFFLVGPRRLVSDGFLQPEKGARPFPPSEAQAEIEKAVHVASSAYAGSFGLRGWRHVFNCTLGCRIESDADRQLVVEEGGEIQLAAIVEYDMETMRRFVEQMGCSVLDLVNEPGWYSEEDLDCDEHKQEGEAGPGRLYAVFCAELSQSWSTE